MMTSKTKRTALIGASLLTTVLAGGCQDQEQAEMRQRMLDDRLEFEAYTRGFRDGIFATAKHEMPEKKTLEIEPILGEMRPHDDR